MKTLSIKKKASHLSFIIQIKIITASDDATLNDVIVTSVPLWINKDGGGFFTRVISGSGADGRDVHQTIISEQLNINMDQDQ